MGAQTPASQVSPLLVSVAAVELGWLNEAPQGLLVWKGFILEEIRPSGPGSDMSAETFFL